MKIGFVGALQLLLIAAKLFGFLDASWLLVLLPVELAASGILFILFVGFMYGLLTELLK